MTQPCNNLNPRDMSGLELPWQHHKYLRELRCHTEAQYRAAGMRADEAANMASRGVVYAERVRLSRAMKGEA